VKSTNLLFDSWSSQVLFQRAPPCYPAHVSQGDGAPEVTGMRLNTLLGAIKSAGQAGSTWTPNQPWEVSFTVPPITAAQLHGVDVYVSLTRYRGTGFAYTNDELKAIRSFVEGGGNVLLMTNHGAPQGNPDDDWTANDAALASLFGVKLENYFVKGPSLVIDVRDPLKGNAPTITAHDSCIIVPQKGVSVTTIAEFPAGWKAWSQAKGSIDPPTKYFALLTRYDAKGAGQLLLIGNSGWLADEGAPKPAQGLAPHQSNLQFALNCIGYLAGLTNG
jgi:hypothetical protein